MLLTRYITYLISACLTYNNKKFNKTANLIDNCNVPFDTNYWWNIPLTMPVFGSESMVTRARLRYTRDYLMPDIYVSYLSPLLWNKLHHPPNTRKNRHTQHTNTPPPPPPPPPPTHIYLHNHIMMLYNEPWLYYTTTYFGILYTKSLSSALTYPDTLSHPYSSIVIHLSPVIQNACEDATWERRLGVSNEEWKTYEIAGHYWNALETSNLSNAR